MLMELILDIFYFPIWWYTDGARRALIFFVGMIREVNVMMSPGLWLKNIFVPMYGQYDLQGRLMSVLMRFFNIIFRTIGLLIWVILAIALFFVWVLLPMVVLYFVTDSLISLVQIKK
ncbi:MAG: hypothetical protein COY69_01995 [Candidatus Magasanikbacteria bacterium CG_4_10_14_0_8_um_filter_32_14]|nr:MAG: hypothetical protein COY69_01995 [Candidatus Magasanikbacteria bacterium CG_4_10_14_0_8_um_filter_32_14]